jgi:ATP-dependent exoDNAse (exonuclease V) beta subunit
MLQWIVDSTDYLSHFRRYYGEGRESFERTTSIKLFLGFARQLGMPVVQFMEYLRELDPTQGLNADQVITMTTAYRTKGLEYRYVFIPDCVEGHMPLHVVDEPGVYDTAGIVPDHPPTPYLEQERRRFYVAATRAIDHLYIGTIAPPQAGLQLASSTPLPSRFLAEARVNPSKEIMTPFQSAMLAGGTGYVPSRQDLMEALAKHAPDHDLLSYVRQHYLPALDDDDALAGYADRLLAEAPAVPFSYPYPYLDLAEPRRPKSREVAPPPWSDPWGDVGITI